MVKVYRFALGIRVRRLVSCAGACIKSIVACMLTEFFAGDDRLVLQQYFRRNSAKCLMCKQAKSTFFGVARTANGCLKKPPDKKIWKNNLRFYTTRTSKTPKFTKNIRDLRNFFVNVGQSGVVSVGTGYTTAL